MSVGRLYGHSNPRVDKSRIVAKLSEIAIDWDDTFTFGVSNKTDEYLTKFPLGQVPAFESNDGLLLTESSAIPFYLANLNDKNPLLGKNKAELAKIHQYAFYIETQYVPSFVTIIKLGFNQIPYHPTVEKDATEKVDKAYSFFDSELKSKSYLVGDALTLADILVGENLAFSYSKFMDEAYRNRFPNLTKYLLNYRNHAKIKEVVGELELCRTPLKPQST